MVQEKTPQQVLDGAISQMRHLLNELEQLTLDENNELAIDLLNKLGATAQGAVTTLEELELKAYEQRHPKATSDPRSHIGPPFN